MRLLHVYASLACTPVTSSRSPVLEKHQPRTSQNLSLPKDPCTTGWCTDGMHLSHSFLYTSHRRLRILKTEQATLARAACRQCGALSEPDPPHVVRERSRLGTEADSPQDPPGFSLSRCKLPTSQVHNLSKRLEKQRSNLVAVPVPSRPFDAEPNRSGFGPFRSPDQSPASGHIDLYSEPVAA